MYQLVSRFVAYALCIFVFRHFYVLTKKVERLYTHVYIETRCVHTTEDIFSKLIFLLIFFNIIFDQNRALHRHGDRLSRTKHFPALIVVEFEIVLV